MGFCDVLIGSNCSQLTPNETNFFQLLYGHDISHICPNFVSNKDEQAGVELGLTQAETFSLELGLIKSLTKLSKSKSCAGVNLSIKVRFNSG